LTLHCIAYANEPLCATASFARIRPFNILMRELTKVKVKLTTTSDSVMEKESDEQTNRKTDTATAYTALRVVAYVLGDKNHQSMTI